MGVQNTKGHCAGNGGLRGHSVGDYFPCIIYQRGTPDNLTHWVKQPNGVDAGPMATWDDAAMAARSFNEGACDIIIRSVRLAKVQLNEDEHGETNAVAYNIHDELPFDVYGLYGEDDEGYEWHLCDYTTYAAARNELARAQGIIANVGVEYNRLLEIMK